MSLKMFIWVTIGVFLTLNLFCNGSVAIEMKTFSFQELEELGVEVDTIDTKGIFSILQLLYAVSDPTLRKGELETFVSIAEMKRVDLNGDGKGDFTALVNHRGTSDPVELFLLCSVGNGVVAQTLCRGQGETTRAAQ